MSITPHGPGFSFLDTLEILEPGKHALGHKWLDPQSPFFKDHFPGNPLMPGVLLLECAAQTAGALWQQSHACDAQQIATRAYLAGVNQFRFLQPVLPNATVMVEVMLEKDFGMLAQFDVVVRVGKIVVAQGKLAISRALKEPVSILPRSVRGTDVVK